MTQAPDYFRYLEAAAWVVIALGALLLLWLLLMRFLNRRQKRLIGQKRCLKCEYDLSATSTGTCPECGIDIESSRRIVRRPISRILVVTGCLLVLLGMNGRWVLQRRAEGGWAFVPTTALLFTTPMRDDGLSDESRSVLRGRHLWFWQHFIGAWRESRSWSEEDIAALIQTREKWPYGSTVVFEVKPDRACSPLFGNRTIRIQRKGAKETEFGMLYAPNFNPGSGLGIPFTLLGVTEETPGQHSTDFVIDIIEPSGRKFHLTHTRTFSIAPPEVHVLKPVASSKVENLIRAALSAEARPWREVDGGFDVCVRLNAGMNDGLLSDEISAAGRDVGLLASHVVVNIEVLDGNTVVFRRVKAIDSESGGDLESWRNDDYAQLSVGRSDQPEFFHVSAEMLDRLIVRVRGDEEHAALRFSNDRYWEGDFSVSLPSILQLKRK